MKLTINEYEAPTRERVPVGLRLTSVVAVGQQKGKRRIATWFVLHDSDTNPNAERMRGNLLPPESCSLRAEVCV
jgi:hypothetical protein